ncbi:MAG: STAS domain-containing protein [Carbonactinosporaceae bacterium]
MTLSLSTSLPRSLPEPAGNDHVVVALDGDVDVFTAPKVRAVFLDLVRSGHYQVVVDVDAARFVDKSGLGVLVGGLHRMVSHGGCLHLVCARPQVLEVLRRTGLTKIFPVCATVAEAVGGDCMSAARVGAV